MATGLGKLGSQLLGTIVSFGLRVATGLVNVGAKLGAQIIRNYSKF